MEKDLIIKALECCTRGRKSKDDRPCLDCPYNECNLVGGTSERQITGTCQGWLMKDALALIKELTEENERLRAEVNKLDALSDEMGADIDVKLKTIFELEDKLKAEKADVMYFKDQIRADTVRKMQELIKERCIKGGIYPAFVARTIDLIAKEMLEGK